MLRTDESPRPMPSTARPPDSAWTEAIALATTDGWRVTALVALVVSLTREVAVAATLSAQKASPLLVCESVTARPSQPSRSTIRA